MITLMVERINDEPATEKFPNRRTVLASLVAAGVFLPNITNAETAQGQVEYLPSDSGIKVTLLGQVAGTDKSRGDVLADLHRQLHTTDPLQIGFYNKEAQAYLEGKNLLVTENDLEIRWDRNGSWILEVTMKTQPCSAGNKCHNSITGAGGFRIFDAQVSDADIKKALTIENDTKTEEFKAKLRTQFGITDLTQINFFQTKTEFDIETFIVKDPKTKVETTKKVVVAERFYAWHNPSK